MFRNLTGFASPVTQKTAYFEILHIKTVYGIIAWCYSASADTVFGIHGIQRRALGAISGLGYSYECRTTFSVWGVLAFSSAYIFEILHHEKSNLHNYRNYGGFDQTLERSGNTPLQTEQVLVYTHFYRYKAFQQDLRGNQGTGVLVNSNDFVF